MKSLFPICLLLVIVSHYGACDLFAGETEDQRQDRRYGWQLLQKATELKRIGGKYHFAFETWTQKAAFSNDSEADCAKGAVCFIKSLQNGSPGESRGTVEDGMISPLEIITFNDIASSFVRQQLASAEQASKNFGAYKGNNKDIDFTNKSITSKSAWVLIPDQECILLPVWNGESKFPSASGRNPKLWQSIDSAGRDRSRIEVCGRGGRPNQPSYTTTYRRFHFIEVNESRDDQGKLVLKDASNRTLMFPGSQNKERKGSVAILLGLHLAEKSPRFPNWFWATFWFHPKALDGSFGGDRPRCSPNGLSCVWSNYRMDIAADMDRPPEADGYPNVAFNPYIELVFSERGSHSNCMSCHRRAIFPYPTLIRGGSLESIVTRGKTATIENDVLCFEEVLKTGFVWSLVSLLNQRIPDASDPCPVQPRLVKP